MWTEVVVAIQKFQKKPNNLQRARESFFVENDFLSDNKFCLFKAFYLKELHTRLKGTVPSLLMWPLIQNNFSLNLIKRDAHVYWSF